MLQAPPALGEGEECLAGCLTDWSVVSGVYPVMRKCSRGVGISEAISPMRSLFMYPGYLSVVVLADMMVETWGEDGVSVRVTAWPQSTFKTCFTQPCQSKLERLWRPPLGRAEDPRSRLQAAHHRAQPTEQVHTEWNAAGKPHAGFSRGKSPSHQLVDLRERRVLNVQPVRRNPIQGCVVQNHLQEKKRLCEEPRRQPEEGQSWPRVRGHRIAQHRPRAPRPGGALHGRWQTLETTS